MSKQLQTFGFSDKQIQLALKSLSTPSSLSSALLATFEPLQACLEYLILHLPECDLPQRFLPNVNSSNPFVSSIHAGTEDLKIRWTVDKAVKECGWPAHIVKQCLTDRRLVENWGLLQRTLNRLLVGRGKDDETVDEQHIETELIDEEELSAYEAQFVDKTHLVVPMPVAPLQLHVIFTNEDRSLPLRGDPPPMYITAITVAAYVRLHILSTLLAAFQDGTLVDPGESVIMAAVRFIEEAWASIEDNGPPEMSDVLRHFLRRKTSVSEPEDDGIRDTDAQQGAKRPRRRPGARRDDRSDEIVKAEFEQMRQSKGYQDILASRRRLPAFTAQQEFLSALEKNRCVVVVGETGKFLLAISQAPALTTCRLRKDYSA